MVVLRSSAGLVLRGKPGWEWEGLTHKQAGPFPDANVRPCLKKVRAIPEDVKLPHNTAQSFLAPSAYKHPGGVIG